MTPPTHDELVHAIADPGAFLPRGDNYNEPITSWSARAVAKLLDALPADAVPLAPAAAAHKPRRGDAIEAWLQRNRDARLTATEPWYVLDDLLDDYRLHADTGTSLSEDVEDGASG